MKIRERFLKKASQIKVKKIKPATREINEPKLEMLFQ
jgi:hypothetical protein